jgi:hypothetical protein
VTYADAAGSGSSSSSSSSGSGGCSAATILEPTAGESVGPAIHLRTSAPACVTATKCYIDGDPTPVASATSGAIDQWVSVTVGAHTVQCNAWDASGTAHASPAIAFTRPN